MKTILLTGFEPFGGSKINPSIEACKPLDGREYNGFRVKVMEIPLRFHEVRPSLIKAIEEAKVPVAISNSAGTFGCNHIFYDLMHYVEEKSLGIPGGFIHVPSLPEQAMKKLGPSMSLDLIVRALDAALKVIADDL